MELNDSIKTIKGIGDKTASAFARLGIETVNDLLLNYPGHMSPMRIRWIYQICRREAGSP